ncbi:MAG TPA: hypothetical protein VG273_23460 [Bryobacteraceae bacterium]|jgi:hypothetical protein|nr:hypothetical protein [Bryobacteraceae bacterium]
MSKWIPVLVLATLSSQLFGQTTTNTPTIAEIVAARVARLTKLLTLTTAQAATATSLFTIEETAVEPLKTSLVTAQTALTTAIEANSATGVTAAIATITSLEGQILQAEATASAGFYAVLTTAQQTIDQELLAGGLDAYCDPVASIGGSLDGGHFGGHGGR